jgi:hypothetical protein
VPTKYFYEKIVENWDAMNSEGNFKELGRRKFWPFLFERLGREWRLTGKRKSGLPKGTRKRLSSFPTNEGSYKRLGL